MAQATQYLTFGVDQERFALPVERVQEILDLQPISRLPNAPTYVLGLTDVRGIGMLVLDLRTKFGLDRAEATNRTRIIVVEAMVEGKGLPMGLVADCVFAVSDLGGKELEPAPSIGSRWRANYVVGIGRDGSAFVVVLELDELIMDTELLATGALSAAA
jgi:purine-binding chemotaxis protein CheW